MPLKQRKPQSQECNKCNKTKKSTNEDAAPSTKTEVPKKPLVSYRRLAFRFVLITGCMLGGNLFMRGRSGEDVTTLASVSDQISRTGVRVKCSNDYEKELPMFPECVPRRCGRIIMDNVITEEEAQQLLRTAKRGLSQGGSNGGASILDLHSGALSKGDNFINIYKSADSSADPIFSEKDFKNYRNVRFKIQQTIANDFGIPVNHLYLTKPTFFSRMTNRPASTVHDEYWHVHVDKETYGSFHYTSLLYLTNYNSDFTGGRFVFVDKRKNSTVEPKFGRLSFFTSGSENPHHVEPVLSGTRYAITVSFTCDPNKAIKDPSTDLMK